MVTYLPTIGTLNIFQFTKKIGIDYLVILPWLSGTNEIQLFFSMEILGFGKNKNHWKIHGAQAKCGIILKRLFSMICRILKTFAINLNFHDCLYYSSTFLIKIQPNMNEPKKKRQRINDLLNAETKPKFLCLQYTKQRKKFNWKSF